ncbi:hypothetical protein A2U01_0027980, partial [Trifolium medium]|nr:hypothetical protein [Trifolium medium]
LAQNINKTTMANLMFVHDPQAFVNRIVANRETFLSLMRKEEERSSLPLPSSDGAPSRAAPSSIKPTPPLYRRAHTSPTIL